MVPSGRVAVEYVAVPPVRVAIPSGLPLLKKLTVPLGVPLVAEATVAVMVTFCPCWTLAALKARVAVTDALVMVSVPFVTDTRY